jgi:hypothetical protein
MLGRVLDALESGPHADNTIVMLWSDHGWQLGEKEHWQKFTPWRAVTRVPLMIRVPRNCAPGLPQGTQAGQICDAPVNTLSLFPTLLQLCRLPKQGALDGPSLLPLLADPLADDTTWPHASLTFLGQVGSYAVSGRTHRHIHYANGEEELYDIQADPYEWDNLARQESAATVLEQMRELGPTNFAPRVAPSVESLVILPWHPAGESKAPASQPDGNPFNVYFINQRSQPVGLHWMDREGTAKSYGLIAPNATRVQRTRPGAVWMIADAENQQELGHFRVDDRTARAIIPKGE